MPPSPRSETSFPPAWSCNGSSMCRYGCAKAFSWTWKQLARSVMRSCCRAAGGLGQQSTCLVSACGGPVCPLIAASTVLPAHRQELDSNTLHLCSGMCSHRTVAWMTAHCLSENDIGRGWKPANPPDGGPPAYAMHGTGGALIANLLVLGWWSSAGCLGQFRAVSGRLLPTDRRSRLAPYRFSSPPSKSPHLQLPWLASSAARPWTGRNPDG